MTRIIVAIGWSYVVVLMAATQDGWLAATATLVFYGLLPLGLVLYLLGAPARARRRRVGVPNEVPPVAGSRGAPPGGSAGDPD